MAKVIFESVQLELKGRYFGSQDEYARCDLARPAAELNVIAMLINSLEWIENAFVLDGALYIKLDYRHCWDIQERAFHKILDIARKAYAEAIEDGKTATMEETVKPSFLDEPGCYYSGAHTYVKTEDGSSKVMGMPKGTYSTGFAIIEKDDGSIDGYYVTCERYNHDKEDMAAALLNVLLPEAKIGVRNSQSYGEISIGNNVDRLADYAVHAYKIAYGMTEKFKARVEELQWKGQPSRYLDEDNDARDMVLDEMIKGAKVFREKRESSGYNDADGHFTFSFEDGRPIPHYLIARLTDAYLINVEGWPNIDREDDQVKPLVAREKLDKTLVKPRENSVYFKAFESYCSYRRREDDNECAHSDSRGEHCSPESCPLVTQVYAKDQGYSSDDEPAFDWSDWERDVQVFAHHPNTHRSYAWRAAGQDAVYAVVNQVIGSKFQLGIDRFLFGSEHMRAVKAAIAEDLLVVDEEMPDFGIVVKLSEKTLKMIEENRRQRETVDA